jgi:hypothetical protein
MSNIMHGMGFGKGFTPRNPLEVVSQCKQPLAFCGLIACPAAAPLERLPPSPIAHLAKLGPATTNAALGPRGRQGGRRHGAGARVQDEQLEG